MYNHLWPLSFQIWSFLKVRVAPPSSGSEDEWVCQSFLFPTIALVTALRWARWPHRSESGRRLLRWLPPVEGNSDPGELSRSTWYSRTRTRLQGRLRGSACLEKGQFHTYSNIGLFHYVSMDTALNEYPKMLLRILLFETSLYRPRHRWPIDVKAAALGSPLIRSFFKTFFS